MDKCNVIRAKIEESSSTVYCIQETKTQHFEPSSTPISLLREPQVVC
jgi:hypothetical protein